MWRQKWTLGCSSVKWLHGSVNANFQEQVAISILLVHHKNPRTERNNNNSNHKRSKVVDLPSVSQGKTKRREASSDVFCSLGVLHYSLLTNPHNTPIRDASYTALWGFHAERNSQPRNMFWNYNSFVSARVWLISVMSGVWDKTRFCELGTAE